jgi:hypothetical protein
VEGPSKFSTRNVRTQSFLYEHWRLHEFYFLNSCSSFFLCLYICRRESVKTLPALSLLKTNQKQNIFLLPLPLIFLSLPLEQRASVKRFVSLQFLHLRQSGISSSQGRYLTQTQNKHRHPYLEWDANSWPQCSSGGRRFMPQTARPLWSATEHYKKNNSSCASRDGRSFMFHIWQCRKEDSDNGNGVV